MSNKPRKLPTLEEQIEAIIKDHTRGGRDDEYRIIYCSSDHLAKEIARVCHIEIERKI